MKILTQFTIIHLVIIIEFLTCLHLTTCLFNLQELDCISNTVPCTWIFLFRRASLSLSLNSQITTSHDLPSSTLSCRLTWTVPDPQVLWDPLALGSRAPQRPSCVQITSHSMTWTFRAVSVIVSPAIKPHVMTQYNQSNLKKQHIFLFIIHWITGASPAAKKLYAVNNNKLYWMHVLGALVQV